MPEQKPKAWESWVFKVEDFSDNSTHTLKVVSGYQTDCGHYGPGMGEPDGHDMDGWSPIYPVWTQGQVQDMITDEILGQYLDPQDESKSIYMKRLMAFNLWITKWIVQTGEPVAILFMNMDAEEIWLCFFMFHKYKVMWNSKTKKWEGKAV